MKATVDSSQQPAEQTDTKRRVARTVIFAGIFCLLLLLAAYGVAGKFGVEKTATKLVMPIGLLWLLLSGMALEQFKQVGLKAWPVCSIWLAFTITGTSPLADNCLRFLETRETVFRPGIDPDLDVLVVLGGGTSQGPTRAQAGGAGDRVLLAAQLHIQGQAKRLITTGESMPGIFGVRSSPQDQTLEIWTELGISRDAIGTLDGLNTFQEIQNLKALLPSLRGKRVGLLTSAYHLPRAMRLARAEGLMDLIPVAADFQSNSQSYSFTDFIPNADSFSQLARCQHEFMAAFVHR